MVSITKTGRRNSYRIHHKTCLRHGLEASCTLKDLIKVVNKAGGAKSQFSKGPVKAEKQPATEPVRHGETKPASSPGVSKKPAKIPPDGAQKDTSQRPEEKDKQQGTLF